MGVKTLDYAFAPLLTFTLRGGRDWSRASCHGRLLTVVAGVGKGLPTYNSGIVIRDA